MIISIGGACEVELKMLTEVIHLTAREVAQGNLSNYTIFNPT